MAAEVGANAIDMALTVARALTSIGANYFLGGSLASSLRGEPRATNDIDFVITPCLSQKSTRSRRHWVRTSKSIRIRCATRSDAPVARTRSIYLS